MGKPRNTRHTRKYPKYPEIPERKKDTRKYLIILFDTPTRPEPDPLPGILSNTRSDPILKNPTRWALVRTISVAVDSIEEIKNIHSSFCIREFKVVLNFTCMHEAKTHGRLDHFEIQIQLRAEREKRLFLKFLSHPVLDLNFGILNICTVYLVHSNQ